MKKSKSSSRFNTIRDEPHISKTPERTQKKGYGNNKNKKSFGKVELANFMDRTEGYNKRKKEDIANLKKELAEQVKTESTPAKVSYEKAGQILESSKRFQGMTFQDRQKYYIEQKNKVMEEYEIKRKKDEEINEFENFKDVLHSEVELLDSEPDYNKAKNDMLQSIKDDMQNATVKNNMSEKAPNSVASTQNYYLQRANLKKIRENQKKLKESKESNKDSLAQNDKYSSKNYDQNSYQNNLVKSIEKILDQEFAAGSNLVNNEKKSISKHSPTLHRDDSKEDEDFWLIESLVKENFKNTNSKES